MREEGGFTLSEMLVSLFITSILFSVLFQVYLSIKDQYTKNQELIEFNIELQWIGELLGHNIRQAGFTPCRRVDHLQSADRRHMDIPLAILQIAQVPAAALEIHRMSNTYSVIMRIIGGQKILISGDIMLSPKYPIIVADCFHAEVHQVASMQRQAGGYLITLSEPMLFDYQLNSYIGNWLEEKWYMKTDSKGHKHFSYRLLHSEELSPLISVFQVLKEMVNDRLVVSILLGDPKYNVNSMLFSVRNR
jgi:prepilin-type N-terminal cleavage/methylation domain-containing protein